MESNQNEALDQIASLQKQIDNQEKTINSLQNGKAESEESGISIKDIFYSILRGWWAIILVTVATAVITTAIFFMNYTPSYSASAMMYVNNTVSLATTSITVSDLSASKSLVDTYSVILKTHTILDDVSSQLNAKGIYSKSGEPYSYYNLVKNVSLSAVNETEVFYVTVVDENSSNAMIIANTVANSLANTIPQKIDGSSARIIDEVKSLKDVKKISSGYAKTLLISSAIAFVASAAGSFVINYFLNDNIYDSEWLTGSFKDIPLLGELPDNHLDDGKGSYKHYGYHYKYYAYENHEKHRKSKKEEK